MQCCPVWARIGPISPKERLKYVWPHSFIQPSPLSHISLTCIGCGVYIHIVQFFMFFLSECEEMWKACYTPGKTSPAGSPSHLPYNTLLERCCCHAWQERIHWTNEFLPLQLHTKQPTYCLSTSCSGWNCILRRLSVTQRDTMSCG